MAARGGALWEAGTHTTRQGCPACCSKARGWGWGGANGSDWCHATGAQVEQADFQHVVCGMCACVDEEEREEGRKALRNGASAVLRELLQQGRGGGARLGEARHGAVELVAAAQRALAKGRSATAREQEGLRRLMAGDRPDVDAGTAGKKAAKRVAAEICHMQRAASKLRKSWRSAASKELARRAEREGGAEGRRLRGVGIEAWRQVMRATSEEDDDTQWAQRGGWTMAAMLVWHKTRELRKQQSVRHVQANADAAGTGAVVFDVETTELIERDVPLQRMEVSVACAVRVPEEGERVEEGRTFWHERALTTGSVQGEKMEKLLDMFDDAKLICAYNGREFDMQVLRPFYGSDEARWEAHCRKLMDPFTEASRQAGRRVKLSTLLQLNGVQGKLGAGADAPGLWRAGRLEQLQRYCMRDVVALAELVVKPWVRVPGGGGTDRMCVATRRQDGDEGDAAWPPAPPAATGSAGKRPRRQMDYDETQRRVRRRPSEKMRHVARSRHATAERGTLKRTIEVGPLTVERVVRGRYEWWDAGLQPLFHTARRRMWEGARTWDPGIW